MNRMGMKLRSIHVVNSNTKNFTVFSHTTTIKGNNFMDITKLDINDNIQQTEEVKR